MSIPQTSFYFPTIVTAINKPTLKNKNKIFTIYEWVKSNNKAFGVDKFKLVEWEITKLLN